MSDGPYYPGGRGVRKGWPADHDSDRISGGEQIKTHLRFESDGYRFRCECVECCRQRRLFEIPDELRVPEGL